jgi:hypothetical protein
MSAALSVTEFKAMLMSTMTVAIAVLLLPVVGRVDKVK